MERVRKGKRVMQGQQQQQQPPKRCPRCESTNTKFCYFNNYSQSQPRHFCKACRRYWTEGGTLRNVPQGGGNNRRGKRPKKVPAAASSSGSAAVSAHPEALSLPPPSLFYIGGGPGEGVMGLQPFHPGSGMIGDFGGFHAGDRAVVPLAFNLSILPGFLNFPQQLLPPLDPNLTIQPRAPSHQQLNTTTVFTSTTTDPTVTAAVGDGGEGFWNDFANEEGGGDRWNSDSYGRGSRPPTSSSFV